jgi:hypothetical protein
MRTLDAAENSESGEADSSARNHGVDLWPPCVDIQFAVATFLATTQEFLPQLPCTSSSCHHDADEEKKRNVSWLLNPVKWSIYLAMKNH